MNRIVLLCVVGLDRAVLDAAVMPGLSALARASGCRTLEPELPALTCSTQASMLSGVPPAGHGIVGNGWYHRDLAEVRFWHRSGRLVAAETIWEGMRRRDPGATCANLFWWHNCYSSADWIVNVRPIYKADGRKRPDIWASEETLRHRLNAELGPFPLFRYWGPGADIVSSRWIAGAARRVEQWHTPTLSLVYLPHLDYAGQRDGPGSEGERRSAGEIDAVVSELLDFYRQRGVRPIVVSEYGIEPATGPVWINRHLREAGWLALRDEEGAEVLDPGASPVVAVADHQVAHLYVRAPAEVEAVAERCRAIEGVDEVLGEAGQRAIGLAHPRGGDLVLVAGPGRWFAYPWWEDPARAPDFARTVAIHAKPGYDPAELFIDPAIRFPRLAVGWRLVKKRLGFRVLMDLVPLEPAQVAGTHGRARTAPEHRPLILGAGDGEALSMTGVRGVVEEAMG